MYDFLPAAETLMSRHFSQPPQLNGFADPFQDPSIPRPYSAQKNAVLRQKSGEMTPTRAVVNATVAIEGSACRYWQQCLICLVHFNQCSEVIFAEFSYEGNIILGEGS